VIFEDRQQYLLQREKFEDKTTIGDVTVKVGFGGFGPDLGDHAYRSRHPGQPRCQRADRFGVGRSRLSECRRAAALAPQRHHGLQGLHAGIALELQGAGPLQWLVGAFYADTDRKYAQRLPTPGYDAFTNARFGAGTSTAVANGFGPDSPYNADLPYNLKQTALFGEVSYDVTNQLTATAGARYYDYKEERRFIRAGCSPTATTRSTRPNRTATARACCLRTRCRRPSPGMPRHRAVFRLGGVNDPLNVPLCTAQDRAIFGGYQRFNDESLWNYEAGVKVQRPGLRFNAAAFHTQMKDLQVTLDAGSCSSRVVFNVPKAHSSGVEMEMTLRPTESLELGFAGSAVNAVFDSTIRDGTGAVLGGIRDGNRLPSVPKLQFTASVTYNFTVARHESYVTASVQHVGSRFTQPSDQENNPRTFVHGLPFQGAPAGAATTLDLELPKYNLVNLSWGMDFERGFSAILYVNNVTDEKALLSFDRNGVAARGSDRDQPASHDSAWTLRKSF
jgi:outer membrane receptor protein involved in Fe transport